MTEAVRKPENASRSTDFPVPLQRVEQHEAARRAQVGLEAVEQATARLFEVIDRMDDTIVRGPSGLTDWTRGHVLTHLARNADALVNLLTWAKTGVVHETYTSRQDRNADIEQGATRPLWLMREDLIAACDRFKAAAAAVDTSNWQTEVTSSRGELILAYQIPWIRLREVWVHLMDLDQDVWFDQIPDEHLEFLIDDAIAHYAGRQDTPAATLHVTLHNNQRVWQLNGGSNDHIIQGSASNILAWLTGRDLGSGLTGPVPSLPAWI